jgi:putative Mn2+ efflux pump MntP
LGGVLVVKDFDPIRAFEILIFVGILIVSDKFGNDWSSFDGEQKRRNESKSGYEVIESHGK